MFSQQLFVIILPARRRTAVTRTVRAKKFPFFFLCFGVETLPGKVRKICSACEVAALSLAGQILSDVFWRKHFSVE